MTDVTDLNFLVAGDHAAAYLHALQPRALSVNSGHAGVFNEAATGTTANWHTGTSSAFSGNMFRMPLLMETRQRLNLVRIVDPRVTIFIYYNECDVFLSAG